MNVFTKEGVKTLAIKFPLTVVVLLFLSYLPPDILHFQKKIEEDGYTEIIYCSSILFIIFLFHFSIHHARKCEAEAFTFPFR